MIILSLLLLVGLILVAGLIIVMGMASVHPILLAVWALPVLDIIAIKAIIDKIRGKKDK